MTTRQPATAAGRELFADWLERRRDHPPNTQRALDLILAIEEQAARPRTQRAVDYEQDVIDAANEAAAREPEAVRLRDALKAMIEHDADQRDNCGDWGTDECEYRLKAELILAASPEPAEGLEIEAIGRVLDALTVVGREAHIVGPLTVVSHLAAAVAEYARLQQQSEGEG